MSKVLMKGNEAVGAAAIKAGCKYFFGYPITPQSELPEYMSKALPEAGGVFLQAESEVAAINMVYGAAGAGARVMTGSSSPGISLKQEGITYCAGAELPCVIVNMMRGGPGLGSIQPGQADYFQSTRGGGNGDYRTLVYAPASIQETVDYVMLAFDKADQYRNPVLILADGMIGQMMEAVEFKEAKKIDLPKKDWASTGTKGKRSRNIINSLYLEAEDLEAHNVRLEKKYKTIEENEVLYEAFGLEDAEVVCVAYGTTSRIVKTAIKQAEAKGIKVGMIRPITLWPFPYEAFKNINLNAKGMLAVEMSSGQLTDDVKIGIEGRLPVYFNGRTGGMIPTPESIVADIEKIAGGTK
ncbi:3-methyl-2-oxobutanoate dehydrogenase subunit VorB [Sedimentibacter sp. MB31-C6]|uniref:3-methyl-2-oxobutanoate dehydrogenase subunit VorB n=1 Tax=Sedimentibacter sp. MB31-C6 TaxID=3109366 RepID=UPI002DDC9120|nr:3-methyl-2-oxobutanoate dehydrogenase subunit VorB [Sedimentibacter sp. MB36-C1]WSI04063.1 3-methyl-2-oxobutanoate dehydrogenase subunit VorB [Sedimentibacter sp. MB36-C1]